MTGDQEAAAWLADPITADTWLILADLDRRSVERWVEAGCKNNLSGNGKGTGKRSMTSKDSPRIRPNQQKKAGKCAECKRVQPNLKPVREYKDLAQVLARSNLLQAFGDMAICVDCATAFYEKLTDFPH
jgi:hypothetical protein